MSTWLDAISNPEALSAFDNPPALDSVELLQIAFKTGMDVLDVRLSVSEMPATRPRRWPEQANAVVLAFQLWGDLRTDIATATPFANPVRVTAQLKKHEDGVITLECGGKGINIAVECRVVRISGVEGYIREEAAQEVLQ